jgi:hypothetical protein
MADQQLKQMLVAYMMLIIKARPLLHDDLDNACEDFLQKEFDHPINYPLDDSLPQLLRWGLVVHDKQARGSAGGVRGWGGGWRCSCSDGTAVSRLTLCCMQAIYCAAGRGLWIGICNVLPCANCPPLVCLGGAGCWCRVS